MQLYRSVIINIISWCAVCIAVPHDSLLILNTQGQEETILPEHQLYKEYSEIFEKIREVSRVIDREGVGYTFKDIEDVDTQGMTKILEKINAICNGAAEQLPDMQSNMDLRGSRRIKVRAWTPPFGISLQGINGRALRDLEIECAPFYDNTFSIWEFGKDNELHYVVHPIDVPQTNKPETQPVTTTAKTQLTKPFATTTEMQLSKPSITAAATRSSKPSIITAEVQLTKPSTAAEAQVNLPEQSINKAQSRQSNPSPSKAKDQSQSVKYITATLLLLIFISVPAAVLHKKWKLKPRYIKYTLKRSGAYF